MYLARYVYNNFFASSASPKERYAKEYQSIMDKIEAFANDEDAGDNNRHVEESYMPDAVFFRYTGKVTHLYSDGKGRIDGKYMFNNEAKANKKLKVGDRVSCTARKISEDQPIVIYKIDAIEQDGWAFDQGNFDSDDDDDESNAPIPLNNYTRVLRGEITAKYNGEIAVKCVETPTPLKMVISEIGCSFNPVLGDQVEIEAEFGISRDNPSDYVVIGYYGMKPNDQKQVTGKITSFKKKLRYGLIDRKYLFYMDIFQHSSNQNYMPNQGDTVNVDVISSHQKIDDGEFFYRCIRIWKVRSNQHTSGTAAELELAAGDIDDQEPESDDEIDNEECGLAITKNDALKVSFDGEQKGKKSVEMIVVNKSDNTRRISEVSFRNHIVAAQVECKELHRYHSIKSGGHFVYKIEVVGILCGLTKIKIDFKIDNKYLVRRCITLDVKDVEEIEGARLTHSKAYTKKIYMERGEVVRGHAPVAAPHFIDQRLEPFDVPSSLFDDTMTANTNADIFDLLERDSGDLLSALKKDNYARFFHKLLHLEEIFMRHEFRMYDQDRGHFIRDGEYLAYEMKKNVFECRPSIVIGDMIYAESLLETVNNRPLQYQGYITKITRNRLLLRFADEFHSSYGGEDYRLIFKFSRSKFIKQHNAVERVFKRLLNINSEYLFPNTIKSGKRPQMDVQMIDDEIILEHPHRKVPWFNSKLNEIQKQAVVSVLRGEVRMCPYLVFGPPGTGKTSTLLEIILQLHRKGNSRLIVAAPSNSAANLITKLLADNGALKLGEFARIVGQNSIARDQIPDELRPHCMTVSIAAPRSTTQPENPIENGIRVQQNSEDISLFRILISTCSTFGSLLFMKFKSGHFTHAIIDEAGQCTEPEINIPISLIDREYGQIILAGDPHQLGPIVLSPVAKKCGLEKSLLSRLLDRLPYHKDVGRNGGFDERMVTQLLHNYRSLPTILAAYSNLSYDSKLIANVSDEDSDEQRILSKFQSIVDPKLISNHSPKCGIYFIGVRGVDEKPSNSTSWRNLSEINKVIRIVDELFKCGLTEDEIGIITPYALQVKDIRSQCDVCHDGKLPKIGSVEEFQGQERKAIIISTVRSEPKHISHDGKYGLGFINNKNRLNVAISRARAILIIIGNPRALMLDHNWRQIMHDCYMNGTYSGCEIPKSVLEPLE